MGENLLEQFRGNLLLTKSEKEYRLLELEEAISERHIDQECIPLLERINEYPWIVTTQSCCGHDGLKTPHVDFRTMLQFSQFFELCSPIADSFNIQLMGYEMLMPRYVFWFEANITWEDGMEILIERFGEF